MKSIIKAIAVVLLAVFSLSLMAQDATIVLNYMKVSPGMDDAYIQTEQFWKKIQEKRIEAGILTGWQVWRNVYAAADDPYQYITIDWYKNWEHSLASPPDGFWEENIAPILNTEEDQKMWDKTLNSRTLVNKEVMHRVMEADNNQGATYILVNRMKVKQGMDNAYLESEGKYAKPLQEAKIKAGQMNHWGVWQAWPYKEGQIRFTTVDGYKSIEQMTGGGEDLLSKVHPGMTWDQWEEKVSAHRIQASVELWELVDFAFPEE